MSYYDRQGNPLTLLEWAEKFEDKEYKIVNRTKVGKYRVSTVWIGLNHNFYEGEPIIFETMVFDDKNHALDYQERYSTEEEAVLGHERAIHYASMVVGTLVFPEVENETD